jgi:hypothetical protein
MADGEAKPEAINLTVRDQSGGEVQFKVKPTTKFGKVRILSFPASTNLT